MLHRLDVLRLQLNRPEWKFLTLLVLVRQLVQYIRLVLRGLGRLGHGHIRHLNRSRFHLLFGDLGFGPPLSPKVPVYWWTVHARLHVYGAAGTGEP